MSPDCTPTSTDPPTPAVYCPFCNEPLDIEMFNGSYGCDTGCDYVRFEVQCPNCCKSIYETGALGSFERGTEDEDEWREEFMAEFAEAVQKINAAKAAQ